MKKYIYLIIINLLFFVYGYSYSIYGKIIEFDSINFNNKIYLIKINNFNSIHSGNSILEDSLNTYKITNNTFVFENLDPNSLYKLMSCKINESPGHLIQNFNDNNYLILCSSKNSDININISIPKLFYNSKIISKSYELSLIKQYNNTNINLKKLMNIEILKLDTCQNKANCYQNIQKKMLIENINIKNNILNILKLKQNRLTKIFGLSLINSDNKFENHLNDFKPYYLEYKSSTDELFKSFVNTYINASTKIDLAPILKLINNNNLEITKDYVLLDCWASWCSPCRFEIKNSLPNLLIEFTNLQIIGLNLDTDSNLAKEIITKDNNKFEQIFFINSLKDPIIKTFNIRSLPYYLLIDKKRNLIYKNIDIKTISNLIK